MADVRVERPGQFGTEKHARAEEARAPVVEAGRCGVVGVLDGCVIACSLSREHGGVHALRLEEPRSERDGPSTTVYRTVARWVLPGGVAQRYRSGGE